MKSVLKIDDPGTLCVLCQIEAIGAYVADPAVGFTRDDMRAVAKQLDASRFLIERAVALIEGGRDIPSEYDGSAT